MRDMDGKLLSGTYEGFRNVQLVPLVVRYSGGTPAVLYNPANEPVTLGDTGTGDLTITLTNASLAPVIVAGAVVRSSNPSTLGGNVNIKGATTTTVVELIVNSDADGATETDPVDIHLLLVKIVQGS